MLAADLAHIGREATIGLARARWTSLDAADTARVHEHAAARLAFCGGLDVNEAADIASGLAEAVAVLRDAAPTPRAGRALAAAADVLSQVAALLDQVRDEYRPEAVAAVGTGEG